jgi:two-component system response regulator PilR (NtrC family)
LNVIDIDIPPLRERPEDLPALCKALLERIARESNLPVRQVPATTLARLASLPLLGNVRELENMLHRALALSDGDALELAEAGPELGAAIAAPVEQHGATSGPSSKHPLPEDLQGYLDEKERQILVRALRETGFNRTLAAKLLGLTLRQIRYRIARLKIDAPDIHGDDVDK